jgi:hypothetical protein
MKWLENRKALEWSRDRFSCRSKNGRKVAKYFVMHIKRKEVSKSYSAFMERNIAYVPLSVKVRSLVCVRSTDTNTDTSNC